MMESRDIPGTFWSLALTSAGSSTLLNDDPSVWVKMTDRSSDDRSPGVDDRSPGVESNMPSAASKSSEKSCDARKRVNNARMKDYHTVLAVDLIAYHHKTYAQVVVVRELGLRSATVNNSIIIINNNNNK